MEKKRALLFATVGLFLTSAALVGGIHLVKQQQEIREKAAGCRGCPDGTCEAGGVCHPPGGHACNGTTRYTCDPSRSCDQQWINPEPNHPDCGGSSGGGGSDGGEGTGSVCNPPGCVEAYCDVSSGQEVNKCHTCGSNYRWQEGGNCGSQNPCGDPNNPLDNIAIAISGCSYSGSDHCGNGTCEAGENEENCPTDCGAQVTPGPNQNQCPTDVTPYVQQVPGDTAGLTLCNAPSGYGCLQLNLPPEYQDCVYLAEAYTDPTESCENQQTHLKIRRNIGNGGKICLSEVSLGDDCRVQLDIRFNQAGALAGNLKAYKPNCHPPTIPPPTATPTTPTTTPVYSCECTTVKMYDKNWNQITDFSSLSPGDQVYLTVSGATNHPQGLTRGRIRINDGVWQETTERHNGEFYISFTIPDYGDYEIKGQVYNPALGWR